MRSSRRKDQLSLPPMELRASERQGTAFRKSEQGDEALGKTEQIAAVLLNEAFDACGLENKEIAHLCDVSVSLVDKWRSTEARGCPSFVQMLLLPPSFHLELHRAMNARFGFGRAILRRFLDDAADLALLVEAK